LKFKFVDLFAGLGGFHVALKNLGGECVFASEINDELRGAYLANHGIYPDGDIKKVDPYRIPDHQILTAGFPCQPFSKAGSQKGFKYKDQGNLFFDIERILKIKKPQYILLENVPNIISHDGGNTIRQIFKSLVNIGYDVKMELFSPHQFGIPQQRYRAYIVGKLNGLNNFDWPIINKDKETDIRQILENNPKNAKKISENLENILKNWDAFVEKLGQSQISGGYPLWGMEWGADYPFEKKSPFSYLTSSNPSTLRKYKGSFGVPLDCVRNWEDRWKLLPHYAREEILEFPEWKKKFIRQNRDFFEANRGKTKKLIKEIKNYYPSFQKLEWNIKEKTDGIFSQIIQTRASGIRVKTTKYAPSLVAISSQQIPIVGWERRYMTVTECQRLQNLESLKWLPDKIENQFKALGNAVNSRVVGHVADALLSS
jgi:DNA (cytosine-5)-methyltransferase 1